MTEKTSQYTRIIIVIALAIIAATLVENAFALNVEKIGKGVVGDNRIKTKMLKEIATYAGFFFTISGAIISIFQIQKSKKFSLEKRNDVSKAAGPIMLVFGLLLLSIKFF